MNLATALMVIVSHAGFWVGGQEQTIDVRWAVKGGLPNALVLWELSAANTRLVGGESRLGPDAPTTITVAVPEVRAAVDMTFACRVVAADDRRELASERRTVHVFPDDLGSLKSISNDTSILVIDDASALPSLLKRAGAVFERAADMSQLIAADEQVIIIGTGQYRPAHAAALVALAERGASVIVLKQNDAAEVLQYDRVMRDTSGFEVVADHALLRHLPTPAWRTLVEAPGRQPTLAIPANESATGVVHSAIESPGSEPVPLDVLLLARAAGKGRIILCQLDTNNALSDARQRQLLINLLEYATTRPQPTPPRPTATTPSVEAEATKQEKKVNQ